MIHGSLAGEDGLGDAALAAFDVNMHQKIWQVRANLEAELGLAYHLPWRLVNCALSASYVFSLWFDQNDLYKLALTPGTNSPGVVAQNFIQFERNYGNLQLQGLNVQATFFF